MKNRPETPPRFWNVAASDGTIGTIDLFGEIIDINRTNYLDENCIATLYTNSDFKSDIEAVSGCSEIVVNINSVGGDYFLGLAIHNTLRALAASGKKITTVIQGAACSAAAVIFAAGDNRLVYPGSMLMIHGVRAEVLIWDSCNIHDVNDHVSDLRKLAKAMDAMNDGMAAMFAKMTGSTEEETKKMIDDNAEKWMSAAEAMDNHFATGYADEAADLQIVARADSDTFALYSHGRLLSDSFRAPQNALALGIKTAAAAPAAPGKTDNNMNSNESTPAAPTAEEQKRIVNDALSADRKRIAAIDAAAAKLPGVVDAAFVTVAKYGDDQHEPMSVADFHAALIDKVDLARLAGGSHVSDRTAETAPSNSVVNAPVNPAEPPPAADPIASFEAKAKKDPNLL